MPKITKEEIRAVMNATKLIPCDPWPEPRILVEVGERLAAVGVAEDMMKPSQGEVKAIETWNRVG